MRLCWFGSDDAIHRWARNDKETVNGDVTHSGRGYEICKIEIVAASAATFQWRFQLTESGERRESYRTLETVVAGAECFCNCVNIARQRQREGYQAAHA